MKKIFLLVLFLSLSLSSQGQETKQISDDANYTYQNTFFEHDGIQFDFYHKIVKEKKEKKEYDFVVKWKNTTDKDIYYYGNNLFGKSHLKKHSWYFWDFSGEETGEEINGKKVYVLKAGKQYTQYKFVKWFKNEENGLKEGVELKIFDVTFSDSIEKIKEMYAN